MSFRPYLAFWRTSDKGGGVEYRPVTVLAAPVFGHVRVESDTFQNTVGGWAVPVDEIVGVDGDSYAWGGACNYVQWVEAIAKCGVDRGDLL